MLTCSRTITRLLHMLPAGRWHHEASQISSTALSLACCGPACRASDAEVVLLHAQL